MDEPEDEPYVIIALHHRVRLRRGPGGHWGDTQWITAGAIGDLDEFARNNGRVLYSRFTGGVSE